MEVRLFGGRVTIDETLIDARVGTVRRQIREYEAGERTGFDLDVERPGTFTGEVMAAIATVPFGAVRTYGDIADALDTAPVAVGQALGRNPVPIVVPCHRIVAADGPGGYSAAGGTTLKERLLRHEGVDLVARFGRPSNRSVPES